MTSSRNWKICSKDELTVISLVFSEPIKIESTNFIKHIIQFLVIPIMLNIDFRIELMNK